MREQFLKFVVRGFNFYPRKRRESLKSLMSFKFSKGLYTLTAEQKSFEDYHSSVSVAEPPRTHVSPLSSSVRMECCHVLVSHVQRQSEGGRGTTFETKDSIKRSVGTV